MKQTISIIFALFLTLASVSAYGLTINGTQIANTNPHAFETGANYSLNMTQLPPPQSYTIVSYSYLPAPLASCLSLYYGLSPEWTCALQFQTPTSLEGGIQFANRSDSHDYFSVPINFTVIQQVETVIASNQTTVGLAQRIRITNTTTQGMVPYTFSYNITPATGVVESGNNFTFSIAGNYIIKETAKDTLGVTASNSIAIQVNQALSSATENLTVKSGITTIPYMNLGSLIINSGQNATITIRIRQNTTSYDLGAMNFSDLSPVPTAIGTLYSSGESGWFTQMNEIAALGFNFSSSTPSYAFQADVPCSEPSGAYSLSLANWTVIPSIRASSTCTMNFSVHSNETVGIFEMTQIPYYEAYGSSGLPPATIIQTAEGSEVTGLAQGVTFNINNPIIAQGTENYITPTGAGVTLNSQSFDLQLDQPVALSQAGTQTTYVELLNVSWIPEQQEIGLSIYNQATYTPPLTITSTTTTTSTVTTTIPPSNTINTTNSIAPSSPFPVANKTVKPAPQAADYTWIIWVIVIVIVAIAAYLFFPWGSQGGGR